MTERTEVYQRLTGRSFGSAGIASLWMGEGCILQVTSMVVSERYRRWYLREVQAIVFRRSRKRMIWNIVWAVIASLALSGAAGLTGLAVASSSEREAQVFLWSFAGLAGCAGLLAMVFLLINSFRGPTCVTLVQTPSGLHNLAAPTRTREAQALITRLRPTIEAAQQSPAPVA